MRDPELVTIYVTECPHCGMRSSPLDGYGFSTYSFARHVRQFWADHTEQACELFKELTK